MSMVRYTPFELPLMMRDTMDRLLEEGFAPSWRADLFAIGRGFPVDVYEDEQGYLIEASVPGVQPEAIKVTAIDNTIAIRATTSYEEKREEKKESKEKKPGAYLQRERYIGEVTRVIELPELINPDKIKATYKDGVLTLEVPRASEVKPKKIAIRVEN